MILTSHFSDVEFIPDGHLDKKEWMRASRVIFHQDAFVRCDYPESETSVASLWTHNHLYLAFWCRYAELNLFAPGDECAPGKELWTRDVVETFIAPQFGPITHYYEIEISPDDRSLELRISRNESRLDREKWLSGCEHAALIEPARKRWTVELRIPARSLGVRIAPEVDWRINLCRADGAGSDEQRRLLSWAPLNTGIRSFHQPDSFGTLRFATLKDR